MKSAEWAVTRRARISAEFEVDFTIGPNGFLAEWMPEMPKPGQLSNAQFQRYQPERDKLVQEFAEHQGINIAVIGSDGEGATTFSAIKGK